MSNEQVRVVFGAGSFGTRPTPDSVPTTGNLFLVQQILDAYKKHGGKEIDTARIYGNGSSETILGEVDYAKQGFTVGTKISLLAPLTAQNVHSSFSESLKELKANKVHILYLHVPDMTTPLEETLQAINEEYQKGRFEKFGISNYPAPLVEQIVEISKSKGYVLPTVYQGLYNLVVRSNEETLFPVLRKHNISFYAYSPLAGSFLTDHHNEQRFTPGTWIGEWHNSRFNKESHFKALELLKEAAQKHNVTVPEIALRWLRNHSKLSGAYDDAVVTGGKTLTTVKANLDALDKGPLPKELQKVVEDVWQLVKDDAAQF